MYKEKKAKARNLAIDWQIYAAECDHSWQWCSTWAERFARIGRKYGLLREYRENGIL